MVNTFPLLPYNFFDRNGNSLSHEGQEKKEQELKSSVTNSWTYIIVIHSVHNHFKNWRTRSEIRQIVHINKRARVRILMKDFMYVYIPCLYFIGYDKKWSTTDRSLLRSHFEVKQNGKVPMHLQWSVLDRQWDLTNTFHNATYSTCTILGVASLIISF